MTLSSMQVSGFPYCNGLSLNVGLFLFYSELDFLILTFLIFEHVKSTFTIIYSCRTSALVKCYSSQLLLRSELNEPQVVQFRWPNGKKEAAPEHFYYKQNPEILSIKPLATIIRYV